MPPLRSSRLCIRRRQNDQPGQQAVALEGPSAGDNWYCFRRLKCQMGLF